MLDAELLKSTAAHHKCVAHECAMTETPLSASHSVARPESDRRESIRVVWRLKPCLAKEC
jgi:hypothetical protein